MKRLIIAIGIVAMLCALIFGCDSPSKRIARERAKMSQIEIAQEQLERAQKEFERVKNLQTQTKEEEKEEVFLPLGSMIGYTSNGGWFVIDGDTVKIMNKDILNIYIHPGDTAVLVGYEVKL